MSLFVVESNKMIKRRRGNILKTIKIIFIALIVLTIAFIWSNSMRSRAESEAQSSAVKEVVEDILTCGGSKPASAGDEWILGNIRKLAHFAEHFVLSVFLSTYALIFIRTIRAKVIIVLLSVPVAAIDETIQIFSNRGAALSDVLLDISGAALGFAVTFSSVLLVRKLKRKRAGRKCENK